MKKGKQRVSPINIRWLMSFFFLLNLLISPGLYAWQKHIRFDRISIDQGLPDNYVRSIIQDQHGFTWFGSANGLAKYDGYRFTVYRHDINDPNSISSNEIIYVFEDSQGTLWIGTDAGLNRFNREQETFTHFRHDPENPASLGGEVVATIYEDTGGFLWIGHWFSGLSKFDRVNETFEQYHHDPEKPESLPPGVVFAILEDRSGVFWVGTWAREGSPDLTRFDRKSKIFSRFFSCSAEQPQCPQPIVETGRPPTPMINTIFEDRLGIIWIGGYGLTRYDRVSNTYKHYFHDPDNPNSLAGNSIARNIVEDSNGLLWFGDTHQGVTSFDPETEVFQHYQHDKEDSESIACDNIFSLYEDRDGIVWIAAYSGGVSKFQPDNLALGHYKHEPNDKNSLLSNYVYDVAEDDKGQLWVAAGGLNRVDRSNGIVTRYQHDPDDPSSLHDNDVRSLYFAPDGMLWIGTIYGLSQFDPATEKFTYIPVDAKPVVPGDSELNDVGIISVKGDKNGVLWMGTTSTVSRLDTATGQIKHYRVNLDEPDALHGRVFKIEVIDDDGSIWIYSSTGINHFKPDAEVFTHYVHDPGDPDSLAQGPCCTMWRDQDGVLWLGTNIGLGQLDPLSGVFRRYTGKGNFPSGRINGIQPDGKGNLWIPTHSEGLWKLDTASGSFQTYDGSDGLTNVPMDKGLLSQSGELVFATEDGIHIFDPDELREHQYDPVLVMTDFLLLNEPVPVSTAERTTPLAKHINESPDLTLTHKDYLFEFEFAALNYVDPMAMRYAYLLEGFDNDWIETAANKRFATYTNVPAGDYVLRVKAGYRNGDWFKNDTSINLSVLPPWWQTLWAYSLYVVVFLLALFTYIRLRTLSITRRAQQLEMTVEERTAQIREHEEHIQHQAEDLEELLHLKEKLITNISHEFRTPLTLILGPARRMLQKAANKEDLSQLQLIKRNSQRLLRLVDQLLGLARMGAEEPLARSPQSLTMVVRAITESFQVLAEEKNLQLTLNERDELWVSCAPDVLDKILLNLLSNAIKYTPAGGSVTVSTVVSGDMVDLSVSDTGVGISVQDQQTVFDRFSRADDHGEALPGAGIGLALVKELVEACDGQIRLESKAGEGATFTVSLPLCELVEGAGDATPTVTSLEAVELELESIRPVDRVAAQETDHLTEGKPLILIVEDNPDMQRYLVGLLSDTYFCDVAGDGQQALERAFEHIPDLVLLDVMLPKMNGFQVSHTLKEDERTSHIPIIMLTALGDRESRKEGWHEKVDGYFSKPFDDEELTLRIANLLAVRDILKIRYSSQFFDENGHATILNEKENEFMEKLEGVLDAHHADPEFGLSQMAEHVYISTRQLQRKLKAITGHNPAEFLRSYRLKKARTLLRSGAQVGLAADAVGFSSPAYFTSCFKAQFAQTPSEYRQG
ncbi:MAG: response regulator, partial [Xanthomonadales bacterium]|nr:response regulator [Gammaproteobacteria bacterium]NNK04368.1 response regulator [Xanthomonadales bacterium]